MTYIEKFEEIKAKFKNLNKTATKEEFAMQVTMTDEDCGGIFYIANINGNFAVEPYDYYDNTVSVVCPSQVFIDIIEGKLDPVKAFESGVLSATGNLEQAFALAKMVKKPRKPAAKKAAPKAEEKKEAKKPAAKKTASKKDDIVVEIVTEAKKEAPSKKATKKTEKK